MHISTLRCAIVLAAAAMLSAGCSSPKAPTTGAPSAAEAHGQARPTADAIQNRIQQVQADKNMPADQKQLLIDEMQHAAGNPRNASGPAPR